MAREVKVVLLGASGTGKSSIAYRYSQSVFSSRLDPTVAASFFSRISSSGAVNWRIWDTAGQERYAALAPMYVLNSVSLLFIVLSFCLSCFFSFSFFSSCCVLPRARVQIQAPNAAKLSLCSSIRYSAHGAS